MYKRVRYFTDYLIEAETDEEALEKGAIRLLIKT